MQILESECILNIASPSDPYGKVWINGKLLGAHVAAFYKATGILPKGRTQVVMHLCHTKRCVNPKHLQLGTMQENALASSKLGNPALREFICKSPLNAYELADIFQCSHTAIYKIRKSYAPA